MESADDEDFDGFGNQNNKRPHHHHHHRASQTTATAGGPPRESVDEWVFSKGITPLIIA